MRYRRVVHSVALVTCLVTVAAGCSSDDSSTTSTESASTEATAAGAPDTTASDATAATEATTADTAVADTTEAPVAADGEPLKLVMIVDELEAANLRADNFKAGAQARVERINAEGGLGGSGRPVELQICVTNLDPNTTLECARSAADDPAVIAVVGGSNSAADITPVLEEAGVPMVATLPLAAGDFASPISFELIGGGLTGLAGQGRLATQELGATTVSNLRVGLEAAAGGTALIDGALATWGAAPTSNAVDIPVGTADVSAQVAAAADGVDAVLLSILPDQTSQVMLARQQLGITIPFLAGASNFASLDQVEALGAAGEGMPLIAYYPSDDADVPGVKAFLADLDAIGEANQSSDMAKNAWAGVDLIDHVAAGLETIDRSTLLEGLNSLNDYDAGGMLPTLDFTKPGPNPAFPRIVNLTFVWTTIKDGKIVLAGDLEFLPAFNGL